MSNYLLRKLLEKSTLADKLFNIIDDYDIYCHFLQQEVELGERINSPIRSGDDFPSFTLYIPTRLIEKGYKIRPEEIWFKDLAEGQYGDIFKFVQLFADYQLNLKLNGRYQIVKFIDEQLQLGLINKNIEARETIKIKREFTNKVLKDLYYKSRGITTNDLIYWNNLDQTKEDLKFWEVKSIKYLLNVDGTIRREFRKNELCFIYSFFDKEKLYQPEAPKAFKFRNTCPGDDYHYYQGFQQLRGKAEGVKVLIITKSYKDVMVFYKYFNEYLKIPVDVVAPHAESINLCPKFVEGVKENYDHIICVSDYDLAGIKFTKQCRNHGFAYKFVSTKRYNINGKLKVLDKDISDYRWNNGKVETIKLLKSWKLDTLY